jgi:translation elongation factor EF-G
VLGRRRARVVREELREGSGLFAILAHLPAQASFGLADDLRARTSGGASAALMLSHWERLQARARMRLHACIKCPCCRGSSQCSITRQ